MKNWKLQKHECILDFISKLWHWLGLVVELITFNVVSIYIDNISSVRSDNNSHQSWNYLSKFNFSIFYGIIHSKEVKNMKKQSIFIVFSGILSYISHSIVQNHITVAINKIGCDCGGGAPCGCALQNIYRDGHEKYLWIIPLIVFVCSMILLNLCYFIAKSIAKKS